MEKHRRAIFIILFITLAVVFLMAAASPTQTRQADEGNDPMRTLYMSGHGEVSVEPDTVVIRLGVQTDAEQAAQALQDNNEHMEALIQVLREGGVAAKDIQTQRIDLYPRYQDPTRENDVQKLIGYTVTNMVEARLRDVNAVGEILDAAVEMGGNRIDSIRFEVSDPSQYLDAAREAAWNDAQAKAQQLAKLSGVTLSGVLNITESSLGPRPYVEQPLMADAAQSVPIAAGSQTISVDLQVTWILREE